MELYRLSNTRATLEASVLSGREIVLAIPVTGPLLLSTFTDTIEVTAISTAIDAISIDLRVKSAFKTINLSVTHL